MLKMLKLIDFFPDNFVFTYKGRKQKKTVLGGIFSIITLLVVILNGIIIGKDIWQRKNPFVVKFSQSEEYTPTIRFNTESVKLGFGMSRNAQLFYDESIIQVYPVLFVEKLNKDNKFIYKEYFLEIEDCKRAENDPIYFHKCIKNMDLYLTGSWTDNILSFIKLKLIRCSDHMPTPATNAKTEEDLALLENFEKTLNLSQPSHYIKDTKYNEGLNFYDQMQKLEESRKNKKPIVCKPKE
jgi:hypothetical protein